MHKSNILHALKTCQKQNENLRLYHDPISWKRSRLRESFQLADRGKLIMACGTGKTFTTLWIKEHISAQSTLVLLPSLGLLSQTLREWTFAAKDSFSLLCVCSDKTVGKK